MYFQLYWGDILSCDILSQWHIVPATYCPSLRRWTYCPRIPWPLGCTKISKSFQNSILTWYMLYLYERRPKMQKKMIFGAFSSPGHHFVENALFTITHSKVIMNKTNTYSTILGGCWREMWSQFLDSGTRSTTFGHLKMGTFDNAPKIFFLHFWSSFI